jgi:hypothetical protein
MQNNSAALDGGGLNLLGGSSLAIDDEGCSSSCDLSRAGDGVCDPSCMSRGCNWYAVFNKLFRLSLGNIDEILCLLRLFI